MEMFTVGLLICQEIKRWIFKPAKDSTSLPEYDDSFEDENIIPHSILKSELPEIKLALDRKNL